MSPPSTRTGRALQQTPPRVRRISRPRRVLLAVESELLGLTLLGFVIGLSYIGSLWVVNGIDLILLLWLPGTLAVRATGIAPHTVRSFPVYVVSASLAVLIAAALAVNSIGPGLGLQHPLERLPLICSLGVICIAMIAAGRWRAPDPLVAYAPRLIHIRVGTLAFATLPLLAALGAIWITNGQGATVAVVAAAVTGAALLIGAYAADRLDLGRCMALIYCSALALIWSFSLRGRFVYGSDILAEYHVFTGVLSAHRWYIHPKNTAYGAMMSLTTLPTLLSTISGASPLLLLKAIYPALLAFFPVALFALTARLVAHRYAYLAALIIVVQSYLFEEMPGIARQEIALLFFVCLVGVLCDRKLDRFQSLVWSAIFGLGMVMSHYGTTYFAIVILGVTVGLDAALMLIPRAVRVGSSTCAFSLVVVVVGAFIWYVPVTHSTSNVTDIVTALRTQGLSALPGAHGHGVVGAYVSGNAPERLAAERLENLAAADYHRNHPFIKPLPQGSQPAYSLQDAQAPDAKVISARGLHAMSLLAAVVSQLVNLLAVVASLALVLRFSARREVRLIGALGVATLGLLAAIRISGTLASSYNQERAFLQAMVPLAPGIALLAGWCARRGRILATCAGALPALLVIFFLNSSGVSAIAFGGGAPANLSGSGEESVRFVVTRPELAAGSWITAAVGTKLLYADRYGQLRITAATGRVGGILTDVMPKTLDHYAWILADQSNYVSGTGRATEGNFYSLYRWPTNYLAKFWDQIYANGFTAAYARGS